MRSKSIPQLISFLAFFSLGFNHVKAQFVTVTDTNFVNWLQIKYPACMNGNDLDTTCSAIITEDTLVLENLDLIDVTAISYFDSLKYLEVTYNNNLTSLPRLPIKLKFLYCYYNNLTSLPDLPNTLKELVCSINSIGPGLPNLPNSLTSLDCANNLLTQLPTLPNFLETLICPNNQITSLPLLPNLLTDFNCSNNLITCFPPFPASLPDVTYTGNPVYCFTTPPPSSGFGPPAPFNICQLDSGCNTSALISGMLFNDNNGNCSLDPSDGIFQNVLVKFYNVLTNEFGVCNSDAMGVYKYYEIPGYYMVSIDTLNKPYTISCAYPGIDTNVVTTNVLPYASNINFVLTCKPGLDLKVQSIVHKNGWIFPGQQHTLQTMVGDASHWYGLNCGAGNGGQVQITVTGPLTYNGVASGGLIPSVNGNVYTYSISDFGLIDNNTNFQLLFLTDTTAQGGDEICVHVEITSSTQDFNPLNNIKDYCYSVVNSFDPNSKEVYPKDVDPGFEDWLTYTIHFQNTGTAPAINIKLLDTLDVNLDKETFEVINYSHYNTVTLVNGVLDFRFPNILLPDSTSDIAGSQGSVQYRIKPVSNLPVGTQIENTANIYFDYNAPIITNTAVNNFITTVALNDKIQSPNILIYPNPSAGLFNLSAIANVEVYNIIGELISTTNNAKTIDLSSEPNGIYFVKLNGTTTKKIIKK